MATATHIKPGASLTRKILHHSVHIPVSKKAPAMLLLVSVLSLIAWLGHSPSIPYLSEKQNVVNSLLVKWSWAWSLLCLVPSVMLTACLYSGLKWRAVLCHLSRLLVAHCIWFFTTRAFVLLKLVVGVCSDGSSKGYEDCVRENASWNGFDISGHVFLLTYCVYVLTEEVSGLRWEVLGEFEDCLQQEYRAMDKLAKARELLPHIHRHFSPFAQGLELFAATLMTLWVAMAITTSLYFHTVLEKVLGGVWGWVAWKATYGWLYGKAYSPDRPDQGFLNPLKQVYRTEDS